ncbi:MAG TPA: hypothetical protein DCX07_02575 [Phycisphaerales bacterium]|nr:hypothetical protein [Phycisphaerales bacterium]
MGYFIQPDDPMLAQSPAQGLLPAPAKPDPALVQEIVQMIDTSLTHLAEKSSPDDPQYYEDGIWHFGGKPMAGKCWTFSAGPAGAAAALWKWRQDRLDTLDDAAKARQDWLRRVAIETFETALKDHLKPDGDLSDLASHREFFNIDFITTYLLLKDTLDDDIRQRWLDAMRRQVDWMMKTGNLPNPTLPGWEGKSWKGTDGWYVNGNVELCKAEFVYLVWQATGEQKYKDLYELQWKHTLRPSQQRWKGYGLFFFKEPARADGSDGSAFVTEANNVPGFDPEYGMLQLSTAARLYAKSRDPRVLRLTNLLLNSLLPRLDRKTMILDATYGSRHSVTTQFSTCAPEILVWLGGRDDLSPLLADHINKAVKPVLLESARKNWGHPGIYRAYGFDLAALLEALFPQGASGPAR